VTGYISLNDSEYPTLHRHSSDAVMMVCQQKVDERHTQKLRLSVFRSISYKVFLRQRHAHLGKHVEFLKSLKGPGHGWRDPLRYRTVLAIEELPR
jgi:hypothetical protein